MSSDAAGEKYDYVLEGVYCLQPVREAIAPGVYWAVEETNQFALEPVCAQCQRDPIWYEVSRAHARERRD